MQKRSGRAKKRTSKRTIRFAPAGPKGRSKQAAL